MINGTKSIDEALRMAIVKKQNELSSGYVSFPLNCICSCGFDWTTDKTSLEELKSGCTHCHKSYCE